jgi:hypothetical protein
MAIGWSIGETAIVRASLLAQFSREPNRPREAFSGVRSDVGQVDLRRLQRALRWLEEHGLVARVGKARSGDGYIRTEIKMQGPHRTILTYAWGKESEREVGEVSCVPRVGDHVHLREGSAGHPRRFVVVAVEWTPDQNPALMTTHVWVFLDAAKR